MSCFPKNHHYKDVSNIEREKADDTRGTVAPFSTVRTVVVHTLMTHENAHTHRHDS